jgi:thiamine transport system permease protein
MVPVVHAVIALPLAVRVIGPALRAIGGELVESAADLGAGPVRTWRTIHLPLLTPALARAAGISAAVSLGEFGATSFLSRGDTKTLPIVIGELMGRPGPLLQQAAFVLTTLNVGVFVASSAIFSQRAHPQNLKTRTHLASPQPVVETLP